MMIKETWRRFGPRLEAQEALTRAQREAEALEASLAEAKRGSEAAMVRNEKMQQEKT